MRSEEEFQEFLEGTLLPGLRKAVEEREEALRLRREARMSWNAKLAFFAGGLFVSLATDAAVFWLSLAAPFVIDMIRASRYPLPPRVDVKRDFVRRVIEFWDESIAYHACRAVPEALFRASEVWEDPYDGYRGEDLVEGKHGATAFRFSEIQLIKRRGERRLTLFSGIFFVADFNKEFAGRTLVLPDESERHLGMLSRALQSLPFHGRGELVQLESPGFERFFKVYSTDPLEARYILSTSLMRRIARFRENTDTPLRLSFVNGRVHLLLPLEQDLFEALEGRIDEAAIRRWVGEFLFGVGMVEELDLNTRIWSKGPTREGGLAASRGAAEAPDRKLPDSTRHFLRRAYRGHVRLWQAYLVFAMGGPALVNFFTGAGVASGVLPLPVAGAVQLLYALLAAFMVWRNASNVERLLWGILARAQMLLWPVGLAVWCLDRLTS